MLPTETVYGLFCKALDEQAVSHVYDLKGRPREKALNLNVSSLEEIYQFSKHQPQYLKKLYQAFLPLSLIHISEPTRLGMISYAVFCLKKKNKNKREGKFLWKKKKKKQRL